MNKKLFFKNYVLAAAFGIAVLFGFAACNIGLGESVDTQAPVLSITYPPADATIRGTFKLYGKWTDDKTVTRVSVSVSGTDNGKSFGPYNASISASGTWEMNLNKGTSSGWEFPDGTYTAKVTVYDAAGHVTGPFSRQFSIDNTPPVFVVSSPSTIITDPTCKKYGSTLKISGYVAEAHKVSSAKLNVFDAVGNPIEALENGFVVPDVDVSGGANIVFARYIKGSATPLSKYYADIYGEAITAASGAKEYTAQITLEDSAKEYKNPGEGVNNTSGNKTSVIYLYNDIYKDLISTSSADGKNLGLDYSDLMKVLNGTSKLDSAVNETAKEVLLAAAKDTSEIDEGTKVGKNYLSFSINPNAMPKYNVLGMEIKGWTDSTFGGQTLAKGSNVTAGIQKSDNNAELSPESFKAWIYHIGKDTDLNAIGAEQAEQAITSLYSSLYTAAAVDSSTVSKVMSDTGWILVGDNSESQSGFNEENGTYTFTLQPLNYTIIADDYYLMAITGEDADSAQLIQENAGLSYKYYGFQGGRGLPPTIKTFEARDTVKDKKIESKGLSASSDNISFTLEASGSSSLSSTEFKAIRFELTVKDSENSNKTVGSAVYSTDFTRFEDEIKSEGSITISLKDIITKGAVTYSTGYTSLATPALPVDPSPSEVGKEYMYTLTARVTDIQGMNAQASYDVHVDAKRPEIDIRAVSPSVTGYDAEGTTVKSQSLNGTVTISGTVIDTNLADVRYSVDLKYPGTSTWLTGVFEGNLGSGRNINSALHTAQIIYDSNTNKLKQIPDGSLVKVILTATDSVGNESKYDSITYNVDSDNSSGFDFISDQRTDKPVITINNGDISADPENIPDEFKFTQTDKLKIAVTDDDGLTNVVINVLEKVTQNGSEVWKPRTGYPVTYSANNKGSKSVDYVLGNIKAEGTFGVEVSATDTEYEDAEADLLIEDLLKRAAEVGVSAEVTADLNAPVTVTDPDGSSRTITQKQAFIKAVQANRRNSTGTFYISVDNAAPKVTETGSANGAHSVYLENGKVTLSGEIKETNGIEKFTVGGIVLSPETTETDGGYWLKNSVDGTYGWKKTFNYEDEKAKYTNGSRIFEIVAVDISGKTSSSLNVSVSDEAAPVITEKNSESGKTTIDFKKAKIELEGTFTEKNGIKSVTIAGETIDFASTTPGTDEKDGKYWVKDSSEGTYSWYKSFDADISDFVNGARTFPVVVTDIVGKTTTLNVSASDTTKPVITETAAGSDKLTVNLDTAGNKFTYTGTITEINGINSVKVNGVLLTYAGTVSNGEGTYWITDEAAGKYGFTRTFITKSENSTSTSPKYIADGDYTIKIEATDKVGNTGELSRAVLVDTVRPAIDVKTGTTYLTTKASESGWYKTPELTFEGVASDTKSYSSANISKIETSFSTTATDGTTSWSEWTEAAGTTSWKASVSGCKSGSLLASDNSTSRGTKVKIRATDVAGNTFESAALGPWNIDENEPAIDTKNVKTRFDSQSVEELSISTEVLSNKKDDVVVVFRVKDDDGESGINKDKVYISTSKSLDTALSSGKKASFVENDSDGYSVFTVTIAKSDIADGGVYAFVYDNADNYARDSLFTFSVDTTPPTIELNAPADADVTTTYKRTVTAGKVVYSIDSVALNNTSNPTDVNKVISLSGTANDTNKLANIERLEYTANKAAADVDWKTLTDTQKDAAKANWTTFTTTTAGDSYALSGTYSFSAEGFDTSKMTDLSTIFVRAVAVDEAGNYGYSEPVEIFINQASDRPVVKINNLVENRGTYILKYGTRAQVTGTIADDDSTSKAVVKKFIISDSAYTGTGTEPANRLVSFISATGDFTFEPGDVTDGVKEFYIYIEDNSGNKFYTTAAVDTDSDSTPDYMATPKIQIKGENIAESKNSSVFSYSSDGTNPTADLGEGVPYASNTGSPEPAEDSNGIPFAFTTSTVKTTNATLNSSFVAGGSDRKYVKFYFTAKDASGIEGMTVEIKDERGNSIVRLATAARIGDVVIDTTTADKKFTVDGTGFTGTSDITPATWYTGFIDMSLFESSGQCSVALTPYDKAGLTGNGAFSFYVDNAAPEIIIQLPGNGDEVTGKITVNGDANDSGVAGTADIRWLIPTQAEITEASRKATKADRYAYLKNLNWNGGEKSLAKDATVKKWAFSFDGTYDESTSTVITDTAATHTTYSYKNGNPLLSAFDRSQFAKTINDGVYQLPVYFMATDKIGNYSIEEGYTLYHNPDGDKPKLTFSYPTVDDYDSGESYVTLGGVIRATGSAVIPSGTTTVKKIYYQISGDAGLFSGTPSSTTATHDSYIAKNTYRYTVVDAITVINAVAGTSLTSASITDSVAQKYGFANAAALKNWWGIEANGSASWNIPLNLNGELNPARGDLTKIKIRACGINADGKMGAWTSGSNVISIHVDDTAPSVSAVVEQYDSEITAGTNLSTLVAKIPQNYTADMYLRGKWYLVLTILDETSIESFTVKENGVTLASETTGYKIRVDETSGATAKHGYKVFVPIGSVEGKHDIEVTASDTDHSAQQTYSFNVDNTAPTLDELKGNGDTLEDNLEIRESKNRYSIEGSSTDEGSGFKHVAFYFVRKSGQTKASISNEVVLDPLYTNAGRVDTDGTKVEIVSSINNATAAKAGPLLIAQDAENYTLYATAHSGTSTTETFTSSDAFGDHVRVGGLVLIDGIYRKITSLDRASRKLVFEPSAVEAHTTAFKAYFPIAQIVDNTSTEDVNSYENPVFSFNKGDDGDGMPESVIKSARTWAWNGTIHSTNLPDGPVTLVILAFDGAGNVRGEEFDMMISNNSPRLAKVFLATDLNNNNKFEDKEFEQYSIIDKTGEAKDSYDLNFTTFGTEYGAGIFTAKNKLAVVPEIVGGNGDVAMVVKKGASNTDPVTKAAGVNHKSIAEGKSAAAAERISASLTANESQSKYSVTASSFASAAAGNNFFAYVVENSTLTGLAAFDTNSTTAAGRRTNEGQDGTAKPFSFTFWDSTEETEQGTDSQKSVLYVENFSLDLTDGKTPTVVINPFYWNSSKVTVDSRYPNSLYNNSLENGHIELEGDLPSAITTVLGADPKVSGKVTFTGTAYDEHGLAKIEFKYGTFKSANTTIATYNQATNTWTPSTATMADDGYEVTVASADSSENGNFNDSVYFGQAGHKVYWTLSIDTSKISTIVAKDVKLQVVATDLAGNVTVDSGTALNLKADKKTRIDVIDGTTNISSYQMDVVPYVVKVETGLSKQKKSNWSVYNRSALGHYPVQSVIQKASTTANGTTQRKTTSEDVTLHGFNLNGTVAAKDKDNGALVMTTVAPAGTAMSQIKFNVAKLASGTFSPTVNGISIINNMNDNDAMGVAVEAGSNNENKYNMQGNGDTNNILTDDLIFDVWEFNDRAAVPINGMATGVQMQVNQVSKMLNFAFANGGLYFSMGDGTYSSQYWAADYDTMAGPSVGLHVDALGYTYATDSGGDTNTSGSVDKYDLWSSRFGIGTRGQTGTLTDAGNALNLEEIALKLGWHEKDLNYSLMKYRYLSSEMASAVHGSNTNLYLVNYDALTDEIRFRAGTFTKTSGIEQSCGFQDEYNTATSSYYSTNNCQVIANNSASGGSFIADYLGAKTVVPAISGRGAGQYVDVGVATNGTGNNDVACVIWYDAYDNCLKYTYYVNPIGNWDSLKGNRTAAGWSPPTTIFSEGGEYCQIAVDKNNHIHIAAYAGNGDVKYAYLDSYNSSYSEDANSCTVDASGAVGEHLTLDVALDGSGNSIPYIGYFTAAIKAPKYAYLVDTTHANKVPEGVDDNERFTGAWEVTVVPTPSRLTTNREDKVNIGVFKTSTGVLNWSTTNGNQPAANGSNIGTNEASSTSNGYSSTESSKAYGNGSKNAVFAYQITGGTGSCVETAQMRR